MNFQNASKFQWIFIKVPPSITYGILTKLVGCYGQSQPAFGGWPMLISHPVRKNFKEMTVMQYCLEKRDEEDWTYEKMRNKRWQLIKHLLSNWEQEGCKDQKEVTEHFLKGYDEEWRGARNESDWKRRWHIFCRIEMERRDWMKRWIKVFTRDLRDNSGIFKPWPLFSHLFKCF